MNYVFIIQGLQMNNNLVNNSLKKENGAVSILVLITMLTFLMVLLGSYFITTNLAKSQLQSNLKIQEIYGKDVNNIDNIYQSLLYKSNTDLPVCNITSNSTDITTNSNILYSL